MNASVYIETAGCAFNSSDSEVMGGVLARAGYRISQCADDADLLILNTCTVKDRTFLEFRKRLEGLRSSRNGGDPKRVVVAGCIPKAYRTSDLLRGVSTVGPESIGRIDEVARETLRGATVQYLEDLDGKMRPSLPVRRRNPVIEILAIQRGCLSACTFCHTRLARGRLLSYSPREILNQARRALDEGVREFWVTGQDTGTYGRDIGTRLPDLVEELLQLRGDFRVRMGMTSPQWVSEQLDDYLRLFEHPKMFRFFHVPIQSGSDRVLREMKREGTVAAFEEIHRSFIERFPDSTFLTDIIVGYPSETEADFERTLEMIERLRLPGSNISKFSARPGTAAARLEAHHSSVVARRSKALTALVRELAADYHRARIGRHYSVLVDQIRADGGRLGRTDSYRNVLLDSPCELGDRRDVEIVEAGTFSLKGRGVAEMATPI